MFLFCFVTLVGMEESSNLWKMVNFKYFRQLWSVFSRFWVGPGAVHTGFCNIYESMLYNCVPNGFYFSLARSRSGGRSAQTYEECSNLSIFSRLGLFLHFFWQVKEWIKLELHGMIRMSVEVTCSMLFILRREGGVLRLNWNGRF